MLPKSREEILMIVCASLSNVKYLEIVIVKYVDALLPTKIDRFAFCVIGFYAL